MEGTFQQGRPRTREMMKDISLPCVGVSLSLVGGEGGKHPMLVLPIRPSQAGCVGLSQGIREHLGP